MMRFRTAISALAILLATAGGSFAQDFRIEGETIEEVSLVNSVLDIDASGDYLVSVVRIYLPAGASARAVSTPGPLVIMVERGELALGGPRVANRGYPYRVSQGELAVVPAGVRIRPRNETDAPVTFLAVALIPRSVT